MGKSMDKESRLWCANSAVAVSVLGVGRLLGPLVNFWQRGLSQGFKAFFVASAFQAVGYFCTALCLAEMLSALPFSGGTYGIVRGILGPYLGFLAGLLEALALIGTCTELLTSMGLCLVSTFGIEPEYQVLLWVGVLLVSLRVQVFKHKSRLRIFYLTALVSIFFCVMYIFISARHLEPREYYRKEKREKYFDHFNSFVDVFPYPTVLYGGLQWIPMIAKGTDKIRPAIAAGILTSGICIVVLSTIVVTFSSLQYPGPKALANINFPLSFGFADSFKMSVSAAAVMNLPLLVASFLITMRCLSVNVDSMSESGLLFSAKSFLSYSHHLYAKYILRNSQHSSSFTTTITHHGDHSCSNSRNSSYRVSSQSPNSSSYIPYSHFMSKGNNDTNNNSNENNNNHRTASVSPPVSITQRQIYVKPSLAHLDSQSTMQQPPSNILATISSSPQALEPSDLQSQPPTEQRPIANAEKDKIVSHACQQGHNSEQPHPDHSSSNSPPHHSLDHNNNNNQLVINQDNSFVLAFVAKGIVHLIIFFSTLTGYFMRQQSASISHDATLVYILCILSIYVIIMISYISFHLRFFYLARSFKNPLGLVSALLGIFAYSFIAIATMFYDRGGFVISVFVGLLVLASISYRYVFKKFQRFNEEEEQIMFVVYVMKANQKKLRLKQQQSINGVKGLNNNNETSYTPNGPRIKQQMRSPKRQHQYQQHQDQSNDNSNCSNNNNSVHQVAVALSPSNCTAVSCNSSPDAATSTAVVSTAIVANEQQHSLLVGNGNAVVENVGSIPLIDPSHTTKEVVKEVQSNIADGIVERLDGKDVGVIDDDDEDAPTDMPEERRSIRHVHHMRSSIGSIPSLLLEGMQMLVSGLNSSRRSSREWQYRSSSRSSVSSSVGGNSFLLSANTMSVGATTANGAVQHGGSAKNSNANSRMSPSGSNLQTQRSRSSGDASVSALNNNHVGGMIDAAHWQSVTSSASDRSVLSLQMPHSMVPHTVLQPIMSMNTISDHLRDECDDEGDILVMEQLESGRQSSGCVPHYTHDLKATNKQTVSSRIITQPTRPKPQPPFNNTLANTVNMESSNANVDHSAERKRSQVVAIDGNFSEKSAQQQHPSQKLHFLPSVLQPLAMLHHAKITPTSIHDDSYQDKHEAERHAFASDTVIDNQTNSSSQHAQHHNDNSLALLKFHNHRSITNTIINSFMDTFSSPTDQQLASMENLLVQEEEMLLSTAALDQLEQGTGIKSSNIVSSSATAGGSMPVSPDTRSSTGNIHFRHHLHFDPTVGEIVAETKVEVDSLHDPAHVHQKTSSSIVLPTSDKKKHTNNSSKSNHNESNIQHHRQHSGSSNKSSTKLFFSSPPSSDAIANNHRNRPVSAHLWPFQPHSGDTNSPRLSLLSPERQSSQESHLTRNCNSNIINNTNTAVTVEVTSSTTNDDIPSNSLGERIVLS